MVRLFINGETIRFISHKHAPRGARPSAAAAPRRAGRRRLVHLSRDQLLNLRIDHNLLTAPRGFIRVVMKVVIRRR